MRFDHMTRSILPQLTGGHPDHYGRLNHSPPKMRYVPIPGTLQGRRNSVNVIKLTISRWGEYAGWLLNLTARVLASKRQRGII